MQGDLRFERKTVSSDSSRLTRLPSPYARPITTKIVDRAAIIWKDFLNGVSRRKKKLAKLVELAGDDATTASTLKKEMLELRQVTLRVIEDALEIEYRSELTESKHSMSLTANKPGSLINYRSMEEREDLFVLVDIVTDVDALLEHHAVRQFLPHEFPSSRNPFLVGKSIDDLSAMITPQPQPGNIEEEMKVLELLRFKRAATALLRAEAQVTNRSPITLRDVDRLWVTFAMDANLARLIRCVMTVLVNDLLEPEAETNLDYLIDPNVQLEPHVFLRHLNRFRGDQQVRMAVQTAVRKTLEGSSLEHLDDVAAVYLVEWLNNVLGAKIIKLYKDSPAPHHHHQSQMFSGDQYQNQQQLVSSQGNYYDGLGIDAKSMGQLGSSQLLGAQKGRLASVVGPNSERPRVTKKDPIMKVQHSRMSAQEMQQMQEEAAAVAAQQQQLLEQQRHLRPDRKRDEINKLVAEEVEKRMQEMQLKLGGRSVASVTSPVRISGKGGVGGGGGELESEALSSIRYELLKIQQELLRRQVLDPKYYKPMSIDILSAENKGMTVSTEEKTEAKRYVPVCNVDIQLRDGSSGVIEVLQDLLADNILARIIRLVNLDSQGNEIDPVRLARGEDVVVKVGREAFAFMRVSKLMINRVCGSTFESVLEAPSISRVKKLDSLITQLTSCANRIPVPRGRLLLEADRILFRTTLAGHGVTADLTIERNTDCNGLILLCIPRNSGPMMQSSGENGPITLLLGDKELQVLLLNQRSLYTLAQSKWSCMEMIAQWLATRVSIKRIRLADVDDEFQKAPFDSEEVPNGRPSSKDGLKRSLSLQHTSSKLAADPSKSMKLPKLVLENDKKGGSSAKLLLSNSAHLERTMSMIEESENVVPRTTTALADDESVEMTGVGAKFIEAASRTGNGPTLLDLSLDRRVEFAKAARVQWKSRNIPSIAGIKVRLDSFQDLEMLKINLTVQIPHPRLRKDESSSPNKLIDFSQIDENEENAEDYFKKQNLKPITIELSYQLTAFELSVFGTAEVIEDRHVSLGNGNAGDHPSTFVWNILSRLQVVFKGSVAYPYAPECKADKIRNWMVRYDRRLLRDVRTISGGVLVVTASAVGNEILFDAEPTDGSLFSEVGSKLMLESEILSLVQAEGWPISLLDHNQRVRLAYRILDKLKVVQEQSKFRLEPVTYAETRLLEIFRQVSLTKPDVSLGNVEINSHHTLSDLRALIMHELDKETIPKQFRFLYKGSPCAVRQEGFRKAWECWPKCVLVGKVPKVKEESGQAAQTSPSKSEHRSSTEKRDRSPSPPQRGPNDSPNKDESTTPRHVKLEQGQRRVNKKLVPVPLPTLGVVQEGSDKVYLLHDCRDMIAAGDVIRIGDIRGRDYVIAVRSRSLQNSFPRTIRIQPQFSLKLEVEFDKPIRGYMPYPPGLAGTIRGRRVLPTLLELGFAFDVPEERLEDPGDTLVIPGQSVAVMRSKNTMGMQDEDAAELEDSLDNVNRTTGPPKLPFEDNTGEVYSEVWLWRCIPPSEDMRPKWRKQYDYGIIKYRYDYAHSDEGVTHFRVLAPFSVLEVLCTDVRCPEMSIFRQRVLEMGKLTNEYFTELAFNTMCEWFPKFSKGIDGSKFIRFIRESKIFPDIKEGSRVNQLDLMFTKELKGPHGIVDKYIDYEGFCELLQKVANIRFPPSHFAKPGEDIVRRAPDPDDASIAENSSVGSISVEENIGGNAFPSTSGYGVVQAPKKHKLLNKASVANKDPPKKPKVEHQKNNPEEVTTDPVQATLAYNKLISEFLTGVASWMDTAWNDCKMTVMKQEAVSYCASTRIAAKFRGGILSHRFKFVRKNVIRFQAHVRRHLTQLKSRRIVRMLIEDWLFRERYLAATKVTSIVRRFLQRCRHFKIMEKLRQQDIAMQKARRFRLKKLRAKGKKGVIYKELKRVNGYLCLLQMRRKDPRNYSQDYGMSFQLYIPKYQLTSSFTLEEADLRNYMKKALMTEALSIGDLVDKRNLQTVVSQRLVIRGSNRPLQPPRVFFAKQVIGQRGGQIMTRGRKIGNDLFVCKLFSTGSEISVQCYHQHTSTLFVCSIRMSTLHEWVAKEYKAATGSDLTPPILDLSRLNDLYRWAVDRIVVDLRRGKYRVMFGCQLEKSRKAEMIVKIQAAWRRALVRPRILELLDEVVVKVRSSPTAEDHDFYYLNRMSGQSTWKKSKLLGIHELPTQPYYRWVQFWYWHDGQCFPHYVNPFTGKYSHFTMEQAAMAIQKLVRRHLLKVLMVPLDISKRVVAIRDSAKASYEKDPRRLAAVINYALVSHALDQDEVLAKKLYIEALRLSDTNALVSRAHAIFLIGSCEAPAKSNRKKAERKLTDAKNRDETASKFLVAHGIFRYAVLFDLTNVRALVNLALVDCLVFGDLARSEKLFRRALSIDPFDERVVAIWEYMKGRFAEKQNSYYPKSRVESSNTKKGTKKRIVHGRPVNEDPAWAGWVFVEEDAYNVSKKIKDMAYWYNPADGAEQIDPPDFQQEWEKRMKRSTFQESANGLDHYYDPITMAHFQHHALTNTFQ